MKLSPAPQRYSYEFSRRLQATVDACAFEGASLFVVAPPDDPTGLTVGASVGESAIVHDRALHGDETPFGVAGILLRCLVEAREAEACRLFTFAGHSVFRRDEVA